MVNMNVGHFGVLMVAAISARVVGWLKVESINDHVGVKLDYPVDKILRSLAARLRFRPQLKILYPIVVTDPVLVMDVLKRLKFPAIMKFPNDPVLMQKISVKTES